MSKELAIASGIYRGRKLISPDTAATHPMGSREKLALFNALISAGADFSANTRVLDLYAGSGALGLEAISRGAGSVDFMDNNAKARTAIRENAKMLGLDNYNLVSNPLNLEASSYDVIIADPPYDNFPADLGFIPPLLADDGFLALSHPDSVSPETIFNNLQYLTTKSHARSRISIFVKR